MIIKTEVELNYINEDWNIDEAIINKLVNDVIKKIDSNIHLTIQKIVNDIFIEKINNFIDEMINDFINKPVILTDRYGDKTGQYESIKELMKERFDNFINEPLNKEGKVVKDKKGCHYGDTIERINYLLDNLINNEMQNLIKNINKDFNPLLNKKIKEATETIKNDMIKNYIDKVDFVAGIKAKQKENNNE